MKYYGNAFKMLKYICKFTPMLFVFRIILMIIEVLANLIVNVSFIKVIIDAISAHGSYINVLKYALLVVAIATVKSILSNIFNKHTYVLAKKKLHKEMHCIIFDKIKNVDLEKYDDTEFYNDYIWALEKTDREVINSFENIFALLTCVLQIFTLGTYVFTIDCRLLLFVIIPIFIQLIVGIWEAKKNYKYEIDINPVTRNRQYIRRIFYLNQYAKEIRAYDMGGFLLKKFKTLVNTEINISKQYTKKFVVTGVISDLFVSVLGTICLCLFLAYRAIVQNAYTVGVCSSLINAVSNFGSQIGQFFQCLPRIQKNGIYAEKILKIINYQGKIEGYKSDKQIDDLLCNSLTLENVCFSYGDNEVLSNINMQIKKGQKIAIVGLNGAGKSTLVKLLMKFYNPSSGRILFNETDVKEITTTDYRKKIATVFQDFQTYAFSLIENIVMRDANDNDFENAKNILKKVDLDEYNDKLELNITKEFDKKGVVFSGGQSQKIAIARAISRNADIVIMDEASSALDPIAEYNFNKIIIDAVKEKAVIIISHRLSTIKYVDRIYFLDNGRIVEEGTHMELLNLNGKYAQMYRTQAESYLTS